MRVRVEESGEVPAGWMEARARCRLGLAGAFQAGVRRPLSVAQLLALVPLRAKKSQLTLWWRFR